MKYKDFYWLNKDSLNFLNKGYLQKDETAEDRIRAISNEAEKYLGIPGFSDKFYGYMAKGWISLSSPVWSNFGAGRGLSISCNSTYFPDSVVGIMDKASEIAIMTKNGAGTSGFVGDIRPRGSAISAGGESDGPVRFLEIIDKVTNVVSQNNVRRGSFAAYLPVEHPDIEEFLEIREEHHPIQKMSIGVCISDNFMEKLNEPNSKESKIWIRIMEKKRSSGYPYIFWTDTVNKAAPKVYKDKEIKIHNGNLCVRGNTLILTKNGHQVISQLENEFVDIWNGSQWSNVQVKKTGVNQKIVKVTLSDGKSLECTPYHKWYVVESYKDQAKGKYKLKATHELKIGDKLIKFDLPVIDGEEEFKYPYTHGFFSGDGTYEKSGRARISIYGDKDKCLDRLDIQKNNGRDVSGRLNVILPSDIPKKFAVPHNSSIKTKIEWLSGYFDADATIARNGSNESIQVVCVEQEFLKEVQLLLQTLGVNSKITHMSDEGDKLLPDGKGGYKLYSCQESKRLLITSNGLYQLSLLGFSPTRLKFSQKLPQREASQFVTVISVDDEGCVDDTFCVNEPLEHKAIFNGILTSQCNEICLSSSPEESYVCCLSSVNLLHYDDWKNTDLVETLTYFLDAVMEDYIQKTESMPHMSAPNRFAKNQRAIGLGVLGWHSYLQSKMIPFESFDSKRLNSEIFKFINEKSLKASKELAELLGEPPLLKGYGERMVTRIAIAPTTSSSFILGQVSPSIEPLLDNYFVKGLAKGDYSVKNPFLKELLIKKGENTKEVWASILAHGGSVQHLDFLSAEEKDVFKTFSEINPREIIIQASIRQKHIDQGQSLNLLFGVDTPVEDISDLYREAWTLGVKGLYYERGANPAQEVARDINTCKSCEA